MATIANGELTQPISSFQFEVYTQGNADWLPQGKVGFSEVDGLTSTTAVMEYKEGNDLYSVNLPGRTNAFSVTLRRGTDKSNYLAKWRRSIEERSALPRSQYECDVVINLYERQGSPGACESPMGPVLVRQWRLTRAWPSELRQGSLSGLDNNINVEELVLTGYGPPQMTFPE